VIVDLLKIYSETLQYAFFFFFGGGGGGGVGVVIVHFTPLKILETLTKTLERDWMWDPYGSQSLVVGLVTEFIRLLTKTWKLFPLISLIFLGHVKKILDFYNLQ
jgi:hypothetical protein